jgi:very-short-patch-repair endonuclease
MSDVEDLFAAMVREAKLPPPEREVRFWPGRKFRFDFAWVSHSIAVEIMGGTWVNGGHNRGGYYERDCVKFNEATLRGWQVYRFTTDMVTSGDAIVTIERAFGREVDT